MEAIKQTVKVKDRKVTIELPTNFHGDEVEVIVLSKEDNNYELPDDFELSDEQKAILDERLKEPKENYIPAEESIKRLRKNMGYKLNILLREELEVAEAIEYYSEINEELAAKILDNLESAYGHLKSTPYFQKRYGNIRGLPIKNFPYLLLFTIDETKETVEVLPCFQTAQNPKKYPK